jgi:hypothetical protein
LALPEIVPHEQQCVSPLLALLQSPPVRQSRTVYVPAPQEKADDGALSVQVVWHDEVSDVAPQLGGLPEPLSTRLPQQTVPLGHWLAPVVPAQSIG